MKNFDIHVMNKCVFLDRDGVLNKELGYQITDIQEFELVEGLEKSISDLKAAGYLLIIITNQSGIAKGSYTEEFVQACFNRIQKACAHQVDHMYFAPGHESVSKSLMRKPDSLMFEKAMAKFDIDPTHSWMIGDKERDLIPAKKLGLRTVLVGGGTSECADGLGENLAEAISLILNA